MREASRFPAQPAIRVPATISRGVPSASPSGSRGAPPETAAAPTTVDRPVDVAVGIVFGLLAGSNLVQGAWQDSYPWLNLTTASFVLAVPISLAALRRRTKLSSVLLILLFVFATALGFLEPSLNVSAQQKRTDLAIGVVFVLIASYVSLCNPRRVKWFLVTLVCLAVPIVVAQIVNPDPIARALGRLAPIGLNAIGAGRAVGSALIVVLVLLSVPGRKNRRLPLLLLLAFAFGVSLYLDGSRGPVIGVLIAVVVVVCLHPMLGRVPRVVLLVATGLLAAFAFQFSVAGNSRLADLTTSGRDELYTQAVRIAVDHPLGIGWGNFKRYAAVGTLGADQGDKLYAHNIILEFWIEAGVLGALAFGIVTVMILGTSFLSARTSTLGLALAALSVSLLAGAMLSSDVVGNRMMWAVFGAALAVGGFAKTASASSVPPAPRVPASRRLRRNR